MNERWETVIGLEIHAQLSTRSKIFSGAATLYGAPPNASACAVDLGLPGVLPVINAETVRMAVSFGLSIGARIASVSVFERKNYFYPDLPKGYQISQYELPIVTDGSVEIRGTGCAPRRIHIVRAHLEEDAGKSLHEDFHGMSGIDLNRAGTPLLEIVSAPDLRSAQEAVEYARNVHELVRYLEICDGNMQEGSLRCDANVSIRPTGATELGVRTETKNVNSFRFLERAIEFEIARQIEILESGGKIVQETRLYDPDRDETRPMRQKEEANDYRYFPDPDLLPVVLDTAYIERLRAALPELPNAKRKRFAQVYDLADSDTAFLTISRELADYFETAVAAAGGHAKLVANWIMTELTGAMNRDGLVLTDVRVGPAALGRLVARIADGTISGKIAKQVFERIWREGGEPDAIIGADGLRQLTDTGAIEALVDAVIARNPDQIAQFRAGKQKVIGFLVGQVLKSSGGKANPKTVNDLLRAKLADG
ncbi:MAG: Asp-tRNA(Asn)/Glu-tRNA(Gln) amidotransferase subunit GatB [Gammaproteobacteria bacterium]|nr:Asp-tRNA(Asn)/Glu-tRNA(Gln) amidotransferase subunit GatB [Gammaproteobacteria bacterium]